MIEVVSGMGAQMFTSFWNDGQETEAFEAAGRRAEYRGEVVRVEKDGRLLGAVHPPRPRTYPYNAGDPKHRCTEGIPCPGCGAPSPSRRAGQ